MQGLGNSPFNTVSSCHPPVKGVSRMLYYLQWECLIHMTAGLHLAAVMSVTIQLTSSFSEWPAAKACIARHSLYALPTFYLEQCSDKGCTEPIWTWTLWQCTYQCAKPMVQKIKQLQRMTNSSPQRSGGSMPQTHTCLLGGGSWLKVLIRPKAKNECAGERRQQFY